jgi:hypothetical protein
MRVLVNAGEKVIRFSRSRREPVVHPGEPPVDGDAVRTLQQTLNFLAREGALRV